MKDIQWVHVRMLPFQWCFSPESIAIQRVSSFKDSKDQSLTALPWDIGLGTAQKPRQDFRKWKVGKHCGLPWFTMSTEWSRVIISNKWWNGTNPPDSCLFEASPHGKCFTPLLHTFSKPGCCPSFMPYLSKTLAASHLSGTFHFRQVTELKVLRPHLLNEVMDKW